jgi:hypothetical protein
VGNVEKGPWRENLILLQGKSFKEGNQKTHIKENLEKVSLNPAEAFGEDTKTLVFFFPIITVFIDKKDFSSQTRRNMTNQLIFCE